MSQPNHIQEKTAKTKDIELTATQSSLLPPSDEMENYEKFCPGATDKFFAYIEREQNFRHRMNRSKNWNIIRGQIFALIALLSLIALAAYSFYLNMPWAGGIVGAFSVAGIIQAFLSYSRESKINDHQS